MIYGVSENGKPYFENCPLRFSLSHSGHCAAAAVCGTETGIDVQEVRPCDMRVARRCFSDEECALLEACADHGREFARLWSMRESAVKLTGEGLKGIGRDIKGYCIQTFELEDAFLSVCTYERETVEICQDE